MIFFTYYVNTYDRTKEQALYFRTFRGPLDLFCASGPTGYLASPEIGAAQ